MKQCVPRDGYTRCSDFLVFCSFRISGPDLSCIVIWMVLILDAIIILIIGVAADLSHIETQSKVTAHQGNEELEDAVRDCTLVMIPAGMPRKPGQFNSFNHASLIIFE